MSSGTNVWSNRAAEKFCAARTVKKPVCRLFLLTLRPARIIIDAQKLRKKMHSF
jgi:hypothetical protein